MKLNSIKIFGFKNDERIVDFKFSERNVTIVHGENGCGKTTLLNIIFAILNKDENILKSEKVNKIELEYIDGAELKKICIKRNDNNYEDSNISYYNWEEFDKTNLINTSSIFLGINRNFSTRKVDLKEQDIYSFIRRSNYDDKFETPHEVAIFAERLSEYIKRSNYRMKSRFTRNKSINFSKNHVLLENIKPEDLEEIISHRFHMANSIISRRVQNALFDTMALAVIPDSGSSSIDLPKNYIELIIQNKDKLIVALENTDNNILRDKIIYTLQDDNIGKLLKSNKQDNLLNNLLYKMVKELQQEESILESINYIKDIFNEHIMSNKELVIDENGIYIKINTNTHSIAELSQGELHLLSFLTLFIIEGRNRDFLMIDEPEVSLNITWQRKLISVLSEIAPKSQIILASHSPSIVSINHSCLAQLI